MAKIVVAIGGNALGNNPEEQKLIVKNTAKHLVDFIEQNNDLIIVHGNGPQVGMINNGFEVANKTDEKILLLIFLNVEQCLKDILVIICNKRLQMN